MRKAKKTKWKSLAAIAREQGPEHAECVANWRFWHYKPKGWKRPNFPPLRMGTFDRHGNLVRVHEFQDPRNTWGEGMGKHFHDWSWRPLPTPAEERGDTRYLTALMDCCAGCFTPRHVLDLPAKLGTLEYKVEYEGSKEFLMSRAAALAAVAKDNTGRLGRRVRNGEWSVVVELLPPPRFLGVVEPTAAERLTYDRKSPRRVR